MPVIKYRAYDPRMVPRRTKLEVPGWTGQPEPRASGSHEYPWHCVPFTEAARAGLEICFPYDHELRVVTRAGILGFTYAGEPLVPGPDTPPVRSFGREYFTFRSSIDLKVDPGYALKIETHPRFYTDTTGTVPCAVPAIIHAWWPMVNFLVFKSPEEGRDLIFRSGEPFVLVSIIAAEQSLDITPMPEDEAAERELQSRRIYASRATLAEGTHWVSSTNTAFDGTYRLLSGAARKAAAQERNDVSASASYGGGGGDGGDGGDASPAAAARTAGSAPCAHGRGGGGDGDGGGAAAADTDRAAHR
jgi:hypothetical protein